ncbi:bifunctional folylpolyglutamate synthase/dihydrofolate synthase [Thermocrinis minervae]|uniref:Dihydrofolate synthase/folylpolyglutamate synthase n=1 Tax=Thermocrinis minervae TaxID=381751 RepID=A0A1M6SN92_9AQUI|nr:folylpolyglutamate synthase/dihydrofolate synthase family protein [Thermocrinis minervae]SHK46058.1 dihydrofolate synthase / folylpolyglutamate synthase [Thermocrinis minervae]
MSLYKLYEGRDYRIVPTLERIQKAVEFLGIKDLPFFSFQVGGTNGKGSTCAFLERLLREHGYKTGWFVSPHLFYEGERWRINGQYMPKEAIDYYVKSIKHLIERFDLTYFEACTLIALLYFMDEKVDVAVFEVGMGGRWDATKVCNPGVCIVTNVQRDHVKWLGKSPEERAYEKLGIYKEGKPLIIGDAKYPLYPMAIELCRIEDLRIAGVDFTYWGTVNSTKTILKEFNHEKFSIKDLELGLWGKWQIDNASLALSAFIEVFTPEEKLVRKALSSTVWEGRMELLRKNPLLFVDGAHNEDGIKRLLKNLKRAGLHLVPVFTGLKDKDWLSSLRYVREYSDKVYLVQVSHHRGETLENLIQGAKELDFERIIPLQRIEELLTLDEDLLVLGSLYLVGEVRALFHLNPL